MSNYQNINGRNPQHSLVKNDDPEKKQTYCFDMDNEDDNNDNDYDEDVSEVEKILEICYGDPRRWYICYN